MTITDTPSPSPSEYSPSSPCYDPPSPPYHAPSTLLLIEIDEDDDVMIVEDDSLDYHEITVIQEIFPLDTTSVFKV